IAKLDAMPGVRDTVTLCQNRKLPIAIVSSSNHKWVDGWLEKLGLLAPFDHIIAREDAPRIKPAPDLYAEAVKRMGLPASKCLVIEDSLNGMKSAHEVGCPVAAIPNRITQCIDFSAAEYQFSSLVEFLEQL
ncbi:MAG: HAD-IA family hydrolase, partial [Akkermansiaceae bacterium]